MNYDNLFQEFKEKIWEGQDFFEEKAKECFVDDTDGMHVIFGMVVLPYILYVIENQKDKEIKKVFSFLERMALCEKIKVGEVLDFTILEGLIDNEYVPIDVCKAYMGKETLKRCVKIEEYFYLK